MYLKYFLIKSGVIKDTMTNDLIKVADPTNKSTKHIKYVPYYVRD